MEAKVIPIEDGCGARARHGELLAAVRRVAVIKDWRRRREEEGLCTNTKCPKYGQMTFGLCHTQVSGKVERSRVFKCSDQYCPNHDPKATSVCSCDHTPPDEGPRRA